MTLRLLTSCLIAKCDGKNYNNSYMISIDYDRFVPSKINEMVPKYSTDAEDISFHSLKEKIYNNLLPLKPLSFLLKKEISFNASNLRTKYMFSKLEKNIQTKNYQKKSLSCKI